MTEEKEVEAYLERIYYDTKHPGAYTGAHKLYEIVRKDGTFSVSLARIKRWLRSQEAYTLHRRVHYKFKRRRVVVSGIADMYDADLSDVQNLSGHNNGTMYLLIVIDVFSRFLWVVPLKAKRAIDVIKALTVVFSEGKKCNSLRTDKGREFNNRWVKTYLAKEKINYFVTQNEDTKANYAERVIRTLKNSMFRYFTKHQTYRYLNVLQQLVNSYNNRPHSSLFGLSPSEVNSKNESRLWMKMYSPQHKKYSRLNRVKIFKYKIGDTVRLAHSKRTFGKDYQHKWTEEIFSIRKRIRRQGIAVYEVKDYSGENVEGTFYENELQVVDVKEDTVYRVENIIAERRRRGQREVLVKWVGYDTSFNSWIPKENVKEIA
jgi:hypothetical protein